MLVNSAVITGKGADTAKGRSSGEIEQIRELLRTRFDDLTAEYEEAVAEALSVLGDVTRERTRGMYQKLEDKIAGRSGGDNGDVNSASGATTPQPQENADQRN